MTEDAGASTVHLLAGLNGAGKTTHARELEREGTAVRFTLDEWMLRLHGLSFDDPAYPALAERCVDLIWDVARQVLATGTDVVLDWNQWSRERRRTWRTRVLDAGHHPVLHYLPVTVETAVARAQDRRRQGVRDAHVLDATDVRHLSELFEVPTSSEGLELRVVPGS